jgi:hypothetical protein
MLSALLQIMLINTKIYQFLFQNKVSIPHLKIK